MAGQGSLLGVEHFAQSVGGSCSRGVEMRGGTLCASPWKTGTRCLARVQPCPIDRLCRPLSLRAPVLGVPSRSNSFATKPPAQTETNPVANLKPTAVMQRTLVPPASTPTPRGVALPPDNPDQTRVCVSRPARWPHRPRPSRFFPDYLQPQSRFSALEREAAALSEDLKARERDVATLLQQKRTLEDEVSRAQRALSRGAVETASMAQGELALQVRKV